MSNYVVYFLGYYVNRITFFFSEFHKMFDKCSCPLASTYCVVGAVRDGVKLALIPGVVRAPSTLAFVLQPLVDDVTSVQSTSGLGGVFRVWFVTRQ